MEKPVLEYYKMYDDVPDLVYSTEDSACWDVASYIREGDEVRMISDKNLEYQQIVGADRMLQIPAHHRALIPTGIIYWIAEQWSVRVHARSGNSLKMGLILANSEGIIDYGYYHEAKQPVINTSSLPVWVPNGMRICQAEMVPHFQVQLRRTDTVPYQRTNRAGGFGSTGTGTICST